MRVVFRLSAIVVAFAAIAGSLTACGQRGSLYLPQVPPLPAPRTTATEGAPDTGAASAASTASATSAASATSPASEPPLIKLAPAPASLKSN